MRPINSVTSSLPSSTISTSPSLNGIRVWKSPIPYLFGGLALMLALISMALIILVCSYRKHANSSQSSSADGDNINNMKNSMPKNREEIKTEPEVLVIMAGDHKPTYLAKPISSSSYCSYPPSSSVLYCTCEAEPITTTPSSTST